MPAGRHVQIVPVWMRPTDVSDDGWHTTAVSPAGGQLPDRTASISPSHVFVMSALTLRTRRHPTQSSRRAFGKAVVQRLSSAAARARSAEGTQKRSFWAVGWNEGLGIFCGIFNIMFYSYFCLGNTYAKFLAIRLNGHKFLLRIHCISTPIWIRLWI